MNQQELARLETEAAEIIGAMKELFKEFEKRIGEVVSVHRVSVSEARTEGAEVTQRLKELARHSKTLVDEQRALIVHIERDWQLRIDSNAQRAGEAHAQAFGEHVARGLQERLEDLAAQVEASTRRFSWKSSLQWALGIAIAIPLTVAVCVNAVLPRVETPAVEGNKVDPAKKFWVEGLTDEQTRYVLSKIQPCIVEGSLLRGRPGHTCIQTDNPPHAGRNPFDEKEALVVVQGM